MCILRFEPGEDSWRIYLEGRDNPIGLISRSTVNNGEWIGEMKLDGYHIGMLDKTAQIIADEFAVWVADGMPPPSERLKWNFQ